MTRQAALAVVAITILLAADHAASAQVVAYRHRSTVLGDHLAGASELVRAQGSFLRDEAEAASTWVEVAAAEDQLAYQRAEYRFQLQRMYDDYMTDKANARRERDAARNTSEETAAMRLWEAAQRGYVNWPAALKRPEYAGSLSLIDSILRAWSPENPTGDVYRRALATEAAVLRTRIANNTNVSFLARVEAVRTLDRIGRLAEMSEFESASAQVAMR